jgi:hypothetical protein
MDTEKDMLFPLSLTVMASVLPERLAVTDSGGGGYSPSSYFWMSWLRKFLWQVHSSFVVIRDPSACRKGSGSFVLAFGE